MSAGKRAAQSAVVDAHLHEAAFSEGYWCISDLLVVAEQLPGTSMLLV